MMRIKVLTLLLFLFSISALAQERQAKALIRKMLLACEEIKTAKFILTSTERELSGKTEVSEMIIKLQAEPLKIYLYMLHPHAGAECICRKDESFKVHVNPNGFPYINLKLNPYNSLLRQDSHHIIPEIGFDYMASMTRFYISKMGEAFFKYLHITDTILWDNRSCVVLTFDFTPFQYIDYVVKQNETLTTIAAQFHISDYMLLKNNPKVKDYDSVKPGQVIKVPNFYNKKIVFYIDRLNFLPLAQTIYDENGMLEKYEMKSFVLNPDIHQEEFLPDFPGYGF